MKIIFTDKKDGNMSFFAHKNKELTENSLKNICKKNNLNYDNLKYMKQIHSSDVQIVNKEQNIYQCDGLICNISDTPIMAVMADCLGIVFCDSVNNIVAIAHAGRKGSFLGISSNVIKILKEKFNSRCEDIKVHLSACIQKCCYEVSKDMADFAKENFGEDVVNNQNIDLQKINILQLKQAGILQKNIQINKHCTKCENEKYFSYRDDSKCGRMSAIVSL